MSNVDINALAHEVAWLKNNSKIYHIGSTYNGVALNVTSTMTTLTIKGYFNPFKSTDGSFYLNGEINGQIVGNYYSSGEISVAGINFYDNGLSVASARRQAMPTFGERAGISGATLVSFSYLPSGVNVIFISGSAVWDVFSINLNLIRLTSWPTWADVF